MEEAFTIEEDAFQEHYHEHSHYYDKHSPNNIKCKVDTSGRIVIETMNTLPLNVSPAMHGKIVAADKTSDARIATETRPKNIKVVYLIKCWHL